MDKFWFALFRLNCLRRGLDPYTHMRNLKIARDGWISKPEDAKLRKLAGRCQ